MSTKNDRQLDMFAGNAGLSQTQQIALQRLIKTLDVLPVQYVIKTVDGNTFSRGNLQVTERAPKAPKRTRRSPYPYGALSQYVKPFLASMQLGDVVQIPYGPYEARYVAHACAAHANRSWGKGTYIVHTNNDKQHIEVMRTGV